MFLTLAAFKAIKVNANHLMNNGKVNVKLFFIITSSIAFYLVKWASDILRVIEGY